MCKQLLATLHNDFSFMGQADLLWRGKAIICLYYSVYVNGKFLSDSKSGWRFVLFQRYGQASFIKPSYAQHCLLPEPSNKLSPTIPNNKGNCNCSQIQYQPSAQACAPQLCYTAIRFMRIGTKFFAICDANILFLFFKTPWTDTQTVMLRTWPGNSTLWITHCIIKVWAILNIFLF